MLHRALLFMTWRLFRMFALVCCGMPHSFRAAATALQRHCACAIHAFLAIPRYILPPAKALVTCLLFAACRRACNLLMPLRALFLFWRDGAEDGSSSSGEFRAVYLKTH